MNILADIIRTNTEVFKKTIQAVKGNLLLFPITLGVWLASLYVSQMAAMSGMLAGIFLWLANSVLLAGYAYSMERVVRYKRLRLEDFKIGVRHNFRKVLILVMIVNMGMYAISVLASALMQFGIVVLFGGWLLAFLLLNPLPEATYMGNWDEGETILRSFRFIQENWLDWYIPMIPMFAVLFGGWLLSSFSFLNAGFLGSLAVQAVLLPVCMVYRGYLFDTLNKTTRRKRQFMRNMH